MHNEIRINRFINLYDNAVKNQGEFSWLDLVAFFSQHEPYDAKDDTPMFNLARYDDVSNLIGQDERIRFDDESCEFVARREQTNIVQVDALVIDYDGELTIAQAKKRFSRYEYLAYTSYRHRLSERIHKFRLIFPLAVPIPVRKPKGIDVDAVVYADLTGALLNFAGPCDPVIENPNQIYFLPSTHPDRMALAEAWHNTGEVLDWQQWPRNVRQQITDTNGYTYEARTGSRMLDPEQVFEHKKGSIKAKDVTKRISKVTCPFHADKGGGETLTRFENSGVVAFRCKHCGVFVLPPSRIEAAKPVSAASTKAVDPVDAAGVIDKVFDFDFFYASAEDRDTAKAALKAIKNAVTGDLGHAMSGKGVDGMILKQFTGYKSHLVAMPEGAGKSRLALDLVLSEPYETRLEDGTPVRRPYRVVFACRSWAQVFEQYQSFAPRLAEHGLRAEIAYSHEGLLRKRFAVSAVRGPAYPFDTGELDLEKTRQRVYKAQGVSVDGEPAARKKLIDVTLAFLMSEDAIGWLKDLCQYSDLPIHSNDDNDSPSQKKSQVGPSMVFTTFARLRLVGAIDHLPRDWIVWIDDPDIDDVLDIEAIKPSVWDRLSDKRKKKAVEINGRRYFKRPRERSLGYGLRRHRCIYTTTEALTLNALKRALANRDESYAAHDYMNEVRGGRITILGTDKVRKDSDALIPLLVEQIAKQVKKQDRRIRLVADGLGAEYNHSNIKGRNDLTTTDLVIELSKPHAVKVRTLNDAMGLGPEPTPALSKAVMLDRLHQAIGRNSGYRTKDAECVVLVDSNDHRYLVENCRYAAVDRSNSVLIDRTQSMSRTESRLRSDASPLAKTLEQMLNTPYDYLLDERKAKADIRRVVKVIEDANKRKAYLARLLFALTTLCRWRIDNPNTPNLNAVQSKILTLGRWIVDTVVPEAERASVLKQYDDLFKPEDGSVS